MPYCPDCKMEFVKGVTTCTDCGKPLIEDPKLLQQLIAQEDKKNLRNSSAKLTGFSYLVCGLIVMKMFPIYIRFLFDFLFMGILSLVLEHLVIAIGMLLLLLGCKKIYLAFTETKDAGKEKTEEQAEEAVQARFSLGAAVFGSCWFAYREMMVAGGVFWLMQWMCKEVVRYLLFALYRQGSIPENRLVTILDMGTWTVFILFHILLGFWAKRIPHKQKKSIVLVVCAIAVIWISGNILTDYEYARFVTFLR